MAKDQSESDKPPASAKKAKPVYSEQFKRDAVKLLDRPEYTLAKASEALGVSQTALSNWKKTLLPQASADLAAENARLIARVRELEMERDILKKAATYFAKESR